MRSIKYGSPSDVIPKLTDFGSTPTAAKRWVDQSGEKYSDKPEEYSSLKAVLKDYPSTDIVYLFNKKWYAAWNAKPHKLVPIKQFVRDNGIDLEG